MKININQIAPEGLTFKEDIAASTFDLETEIVKFRRPLKIKAQVSKITNAVTVDLTLDSLMYITCSRCLNEFEIDLRKNLKLNYSVSKLERQLALRLRLSVNGERSRTIDLDPDIREEIILDYPLKPLCNPNCKGLCPKCGVNLNEKKCDCNS